jgi:hypothetical protein
MGIVLRSNNGITAEIYVGQEYEQTAANMDIRICLSLRTLKAKPTASISHLTESSAYLWE